MKHKCQFALIKDGEEGVFRCNLPSSGAIVRGLEVCPIHYALLKRDNLLRQNKGIDINGNCFVIIDIKRKYKTHCVTKLSIEEYKQQIESEFNELPLEEREVIDCDDTLPFTFTDDDIQ